MRLMKDLIEMVEHNPRRVPRFSSTGTCARDIKHIYEHNRPLLAGYLLASISNSNKDYSKPVQKINDRYVHIPHRSPDELIRFLNQDGNIFKPEIVIGVIHAIEKADPCQKTRVMQSVLDAFIRKVETPEQINALEEILKQTDLATTREAMGNNREYGAVDVLTAKLCNVQHGSYDWDKIDLYEQIGARLVEYGADLEAKQMSRSNGEFESFNGALHRACYEMEEDHRNGAVAIDILLRLGSKWEDFIDNPRFPNAGKIIANHPVVKQRLLTQISERVGQKRSAPRSAM